jgi:hypothetical protein
MAGLVVRDDGDADDRAKNTRHPCTVGKQKAKAAGPGKVNATKTKKVRVAAARNAAGRHKKHVKAAKTAAGKAGKRAKVAAAKPC